MMDTDQAKRHLNKAKNTVKFLQVKVTDNQIPQYKRDLIRQDLEALEFLLVYAEEALSLRGVEL